MGQDDITCAKCDKPCGYDDEAAIWFGTDRRGDIHAKICRRCKDSLKKQFMEFFGCGSTSDEYGIDIEWDEVDTLLNKLERREDMRVFIITDKERYERKKP